ncbi:MAG: DUF4186 domain-containing protein [Candidatus Omnitrophica bacterium]|nr:DUF4186 domain-containing protein [Candidatus Omnitrophota bacterium]MDD5429666.1 DUF4186 domain-containing protein [Candidatus Omnitrophota bacterium]
MSRAGNIESLLQKSKFRSSFKLTLKDLAYIKRVGLAKIKSHAHDFIVTRLKPANPENDGKQTPFRGHPVFKAQHATATCCRKCLYKWYEIPEKRQLSETETTFIEKRIMNWINARLQ